MRKQALFSLMLLFGVVGGGSLMVTPAKAAIAQAQNMKVQGQVVDQDGQPLIGATVRLKGAQTGTVTDFEGKFTLDVPQNATLLVSYIGYKDREFAVRGRANLGEIQLESDNNVLEPVRSAFF